LRPQHRESHAEYLSRRLREAWAAAENRQAVTHVDRHGIYLEFSSEPGFDLVLKSLEARRSGILLLNVRTEGLGEEQTTKATVFLPRSKSGHFLRKVRAYAVEDNERIDAKTGETVTTPKNAKLIDSIADVRAAVLESFWLDLLEKLPGERPDWVEAWLSSEDLGVIERFVALCEQLHIDLGEGRVTFPNARYV
jgi:hypothetical protein